MKKTSRWADNALWIFSSNFEEIVEIGEKHLKDEQILKMLAPFEFCSFAWDRNLSLKWNEKVLPRISDLYQDNNYLRNYLVICHLHTVFSLQKQYFGICAQGEYQRYVLSARKIKTAERMVIEMVASISVADLTFVIPWDCTLDFFFTFF